MNDGRLLRLERLLEATRALGHALDFEPFLQTVVAVISELTGSEAASILERDGSDGSLRFLAAPRRYQDALRGVQVSMDGSAAGWVYREAKPLHIPDLKTDTRYFSALDFALGFETRSLLAVPLMVRGTPLGVLEAVNKNKTDYTEEDVTILETLAVPVALAIHNTNLQRRIDASLSELSELDRLKTDFIAITSHELRTPLGVILGHATFLRESVDESYRGQLDVIIKNASRLKEIVESLASMDNYKTGVARLRQRAVSITHIIEEVVTSFTEMASKRNITLKVDSSGNDLYVEADEAKISIVLSNLIKNAILFTDKGGRVLVKSGSVPGYVMVSVIDDGIGIPARDLPRIFDRFFQVESHLTRRHGGMGLGLAVAKVMIEMHGGRIWAESVEGKGSNFSFLLPVNSAQAESAP